MSNDSVMNIGHPYLINFAIAGRLTSNILCFVICHVRKAKRAILSLLIYRNALFGIIHNDLCFTGNDQGIKVAQMPEDTFSKPADSWSSAYRRKTI